ncbi:isochorismate synthase [Actinomyces wuliandei]|uniref:isochorismate synthase n=1 Tax=Actinomyces wuliandei TaxID=2057743 RepID=UPI000FDC6160|nr:chorismate-binding protein [Actinomyces wuliandei]
MTTSLPQPARTDDPPEPLPDFLLASRHWEMRAQGGRLLQPVLAPDPRSVVSDLLAVLRHAEEEAGQAHVLCGLIPFDLSEPAHLRVTSSVSWRPRRWSTPSPAPQDPPALPGHGGQVPRPPQDSPLAALTDTPATGAALTGGTLAEAATGLTDTGVTDTGLTDTVFMDNVRTVLDLLGHEGLQKVVLSRWVDVALPDSLDPARLASCLVGRLMTDRHRDADVYCATDVQGRTWLGASPEVVADTRDGLFLTAPLAGSLPRSVERTQAVARLTGSPKEMREHALVVDQVAATLGDVVDDLQVPSAPSLLATDTMWHLGTRVTGRLRPGVSCLDAALSLHPTPAVCGVPTARAAEVIRSLEGRSRELYSGLVGWTDSSGDGRWSLVIRGACLSRQHLRVQAGAGIVEGSSPEREHAETAAKLSTMLSTLSHLDHLNGAPAPSDALDSPRQPLR